MFYMAQLSLLCAAHPASFGWWLCLLPSIHSLPGSPANLSCTAIGHLTVYHTNHSSITSLCTNTPQQLNIIIHQGKKQIIIRDYLFSSSRKLYTNVEWSQGHFEISSLLHLIYTPLKLFQSCKESWKGARKLTSQQSSQCLHIRS